MCFWKGKQKRAVFYLYWHFLTFSVPREPHLLSLHQTKNVSCQEDDWSLEPVSKFTSPHLNFTAHFWLYTHLKSGYNSRCVHTICLKHQDHPLFSWCIAHSLSNFVYKWRSFIIFHLLNPLLVMMQKTFHIRMTTKVSSSKSRVVSEYFITDDVWNCMIILID